jgi:hypothetical protein
MLRVEIRLFFVADATGDIDTHEWMRFFHLARGHSHVGGWHRERLALPKRVYSIGGGGKSPPMPRPGWAQLYIPLWQVISEGANSVERSPHQGLRVECDLRGGVLNDTKH